MTVTGTVGAAVMNLLVLLLILLGVPTVSPWAVAADVFLTKVMGNTPAGTLIGLIGTLALNIFSAFLILLVLRWSGYDFAIIKGVLTINAFSFVTMGLFMPPLRIAPQVQVGPVTNLVALTVLTITGGLIAGLLRRFHTIYVP
ncbi:MAG: hypothetical protein AB1497_04900 [Bacillota bacterium]